MEELVSQIRQAEKMMEEVSPVLVTNNWPQASRKMSELLKKLTEVLPLWMNCQHQLEGIDVNQIIPIYERLIYGMQVGDTIQLADVLIYELQGIFQSVCEQYESV